MQQNNQDVKVLVFHPEDATTNFLSTIYNDKDCTIVRNRPGNAIRKRMILEHDVIIMLGHGTARGLGTADMMPIIDSNYVYLLRDKICIGVWCNADQFFNKYDLEGLYTGMIISEEYEAIYEGVLATSSEISSSNINFARAIANNLDILDYHTSACRIKKDYDVVDAVTAFNNNNIFSRNKNQTKFN